MNDAELLRRDLAVLWHPCTQMHDHETLPLVPVARAEGPWLHAADGRRWLDAISSWWVNLFGHGHPRIAGAVHAQLDRLAHTLLAGVSHEPAVGLAEDLLAAAGAPFARVFYADNGASAIEIALKMSFHAWRNAGDTRRTRFMAIEGGYHGETLGALSVTDVALYRETYAPLLATPRFAPGPAPEPGESRRAAAERAADALDAMLAEHAHETCAVVVEPLVQCAGGMRMHDPEWLRRVRAACDRHRVHLIADEIAVGFGRTGSLFACEQAGIAADFLVLSKGLTGGFLPLSAVLTTTAVYEAFYAEYRTRRAFLHSHSYTGNPLACAAARATLALFRDEPVIERNRSLGERLGAAIAPLADLPHVGNVRRCGMIAALDLLADPARGVAFPWEERRGLRVYRRALDHGVLLRPLGHVVYFMPPYVIGDEELALMAAAAREGILAATADARPARSAAGPRREADPAALEV
jgi:adenosylmethionine-8-amino-7-oxononanoate aminotransferase